MAKKKRKNKKTLKQTRQKRVATGQAKKQDEEKAIAVLDVRPDLRKTIILTAVCLGILFVLFLTQSRWSGALE